MLWWYHRPNGLCGCTRNSEQFSASRLWQVSKDLGTGQALTVAVSWCMTRYLEDFCTGAGLKAGALEPT